MATPSIEPERSLVRLDSDNWPIADSDSGVQIGLDRDLTDEARRGMLRRSIASALRAGGHAGLVDAEAQTTQRAPTNVSGIVALVALFWMLGATLGDRAGLSFGWWPLMALGVVVAVGLVMQIPGMGMPAAWAALLAVPATFAWQLDSQGAVWLTHVLPAATALAVAVVTSRISVRSAREFGVAVAAVVRSAPLLAPLALVVLVVPALSADVWQAAARLDAFDLAVLLAVTVLPLFAVVRRQLMRDLPAVTRSRSIALARSDARGVLTRDMLAERLPTETFKVVDLVCGRDMASAWPEEPAEYAPLIAADERDALQRPLTARLAVCVVIVGLALTAYLYVVLAAIVDPHVAQEWNGRRVPTWRLDVAHFRVFFPHGLFLQLVALLGVLATATFLAFALLEERFSNALGEALLQLPVDRLLALAVPYLALREERVMSESQAFDDWDPGAPPEELWPEETPS